MATTVMIVANDRATATSLSALFNRKEFIVLAVNSGRQAMLQGKARKPDAIIVDSTSPRLNSKRLCRSLRAETRAVIIALVTSTSKGEPLKAHHVLLKSTSPRKFVARVKSALDSRPPREIKSGGLILDLERRRVLRGGKAQQLTPKEFELLKLLMNHADEIVSREAIMREIWDTDYLGDTRTLDVHIRWLREKIEDNASKPSRLRTLRGQGYRLETKPHE